VANSEHFSSSSLPVTPAVEAFPSTTPSTRPASADTNENRAESDELARLKFQLAQAQNQISHLEHSTSKAPQPPVGWATNEDAAKTEPPLNFAWGQIEEGYADQSDVLSRNAFNRSRVVWNNPTGLYGATHVQAPVTEHPPAAWPSGRGMNHGLAESSLPMYNSLNEKRHERPNPETDYLIRSFRRAERFDHSNTTSAQPYGGSFNIYNTPVGQYDGSMLHAGVPVNSMTGAPLQNHLGLGPSSSGMYSQAQQSFDTALSPYASEFTSKTPWKTEV
jgi:hypothetical protein